MIAHSMRKRGREYVVSEIILKDFNITSFINCWSDKASCRSGNKGIWLCKLLVLGATCDYHCDDCCVSEVGPDYDYGCTWCSFFCDVIWCRLGAGDAGGCEWLVKGHNNQLT